jgi:hypothetical protein
VCEREREREREERETVCERERDCERCNNITWGYVTDSALVGQMSNYKLEL